MNTLIAVVAFVAILAVPVGAIVASFRPSRQGVALALRESVLFDPRHPQISYR